MKKSKQKNQESRLYNTPPKKRAQKKPDITSAPSSPRVLIIEDDQPTLDALLFKLNALHIAADSASDGEIAIEKIRAQKWTVIIVDILLPKKDGFAILDAIRHESWSSRASIFVFSNLGRTEHIRRALDMGAREFIEKTKVTVSDVAKKITDALTEIPA